MDYTIRICGEAGQGIQTVGDTLAKVFARSGFHVFTHQDYESRVRGGHNFFQIRFSDKPVMSSRNRLDLLTSFDKEGILLYGKELSETGKIICDAAAMGLPQNSEFRTVNFMDIPFNRLATEHGGSKIMVNTVAIGAILGLFGMELSILLSILRNTFKNKGDNIIKANTEAAIAGHTFAAEGCADCSFHIPKTLPSEVNMLISGIDAIGFGAATAGCNFYTAYPMTPSTGIMNFLADKSEDYGILVEQAEDEIAAINMALGASFAGARAMTGTAGGGFALMVEGLSLAGMTETPIVIALGQRPAPATGLPTRTEQGDLLFALHTAHGEFPRIVFAPGSPEQAFYLMNKAFDLAEKYQLPVIVIFDQYLADTQWTCKAFDLSRLKYSDYRLRGEAVKNLSAYKRHAFTDNGVSPLAIPGDSSHLVITDSDEHNEEGHMIEDAATRIKMVNKRLFKKLPFIRKELAPPLLYGNADPDIVVVCWGSTYGVTKEAVEALTENKKIAMLHFSEIWPFPPADKFDYIALLKKASVTICMENNATGQFSRLIKAETGFEFHKNINRYDGRPFLLEELIGAINAVLG